MALQLWAVDGSGGFLAVPGLSKKLLKTAQQKTILRQFTIPLDAFGAKMGE